MKTLLRLLFTVFLLSAAAGAAWYVWQNRVQEPSHQVLTRESVLTRIQNLNRLESTAFHIDTIIKTEKKGNWYALWQDSQTGLFIAQGKVLAGLDLNKLNSENVHVVDNKVIISLPPVEILSVGLDNIEVYDIKTGSLGLHPIDKSVFQSVQEQAKKQVLAGACKADILAHAQTQAQQQLETLFALTQTEVSIYPSALPPCKA
ncbi:DUF4230 domain-containing protein [Neisseria dumasiana]|uniref:DUF4230 domain-containing protein n=1 Tax=Neisseria dumasiana TaxID=1931275 RepID=A0A1X3DKI9_9NEIS|nr:DUF4230 domain-containing protein [Neisseria dumasiana]OSI14558.1 hypothetical protein BV914_09765 [Neisseria dumasiana]OSI24242.1 hypothetical protein BV912_02560 [Neisseria dumasiana]